MSTSPPAAPVEIRRLSETDLDRVMEIEVAAFTTPWQRETFLNLLSRRDSDLIVAVSDARVVGYAVTWTVLDQAELGNVAVAGDARGGGVGKRLVREALGVVRARGARECFLEVRESNASAIRLYEALGFVQVGLRRRYYTRPVESALVMRVDLS